MGKSKDLATGETRFVNTAGDTMTGNLAINNASGSQVTLHRSDTTIANDDLVGQIIMSGDDADSNASGTRGYIRGRSQGTGGGLKMEFGTAGGGIAMGSDPRMTINADGYVTMPNQPAFMAQANTTDTLVANAGYMKVSYGANPEYNIGSHFDKTNSRFTAPVAGRYIFHAAYMLQSNLSGFTYRFIVLFKNGASTNSETMMGDPGNASYATLAVTYSLDLNANDYVEVYTKQVGGSNATIRQGYKYFTGYLIG